MNIPPPRPGMEQRWFLAGDVDGMQADTFRPWLPRERGKYLTHAGLVLCERRLPGYPYLSAVFDPPRRIGRPAELCMDYGRHDDMVDAMSYAMRLAVAGSRNRWRRGWLFRWGSGWMGWHWSKRNKRLCLNLLPFVTFWVTLPGGKTPAED